jgi:DNA-binding transcriptional ArsR family regulator
MPRETVHLTSQMVRTLAHPLRTRLLGLLRVEGPSTATALAKRTGTNSGATSYHLRQLAAVGLVEEEDREGRKRYWRAAHQVSSWRDTEHDEDPEARAAADWLMRYSNRIHARWIDEWLDTRYEWPSEWRDTIDQSDFLIKVTRDQLEELNQRVHELIAHFDDSPADDETEEIVILYNVLPKRALSV